MYIFNILDRYHEIVLRVSFPTLQITPQSESQNLSYVILIMQFPTHGAVTDYTQWVIGYRHEKQPETHFSHR